MSTNLMNSLESNVLNILFVNDISISRVIQEGGRLDGPIQFKTYGKLANIRSPDGCMISLFQPDWESFVEKPPIQVVK